MYIICLFGGAPRLHRGCAHGPPRHSTAISTAFHGQPWTLHGLPRTLHGLPRTFHALPRNAAASSGTPCGGPWHYPGNFDGNFDGKVHGNLHGNRHGNPRQAPTAYHGRSRYNGKTHGNAYGMEVAMEYAVAVAVVLPWVAMVGITEVATGRTAARAMATTVALAVEAPCTMESRGPCRGNPRISPVARGKTTEVPRSLPRTSTKKSNNKGPSYRVAKNLFS